MIVAGAGPAGGCAVGGLGGGGEGGGEGFARGGLDFRGGLPACVGVAESAARLTRPGALVDLEAAAAPANPAALEPEEARPRADEPDRAGERS
jgi:hypothetical protein